MLSEIKEYNIFSKEVHFIIIQQIVKVFRSLAKNISHFKINYKKNNIKIDKKNNTKIELRKKTR